MTIKIPNAVLDAFGAKNGDEFFTALADLKGAVDQVTEDNKALTNLVEEQSNKIETLETDAKAASSDKLDREAILKEAKETATNVASRKTLEALADTGTTPPVKGSANSEANTDGSGAPVEKVDFSNMDKEQLEAAWSANAGLKKDWASKDTFVGYHLAVQNGQVK